MIEGGSRVFDIDMMTGVCLRVDMSFKETKTFPTYRLDGDRGLNIYVAPQRWISEKDQLEGSIRRSTRKIGRDSS